MQRPGQQGVAGGHLRTTGSEDHLGCRDDLDGGEHEPEADEPGDAGGCRSALASRPRRHHHPHRNHERGHGRDLGRAGEPLEGEEERQGQTPAARSRCSLAQSGVGREHDPRQPVVGQKPAEVVGQRNGQSADRERRSADRGTGAADSQAPRQQRGPQRAEQEVERDLEADAGEWLEPEIERPRRVEEKPVWVGEQGLATVDEPVPQHSA
jgi:hypothetical protein